MIFVLRAHYESFDLRSWPSRRRPRLFHPEDEVELIDELWRSPQTEGFALTGDQLAELDRHLDRMDGEGPVGTAWDDVRAKMTKMSTSTLA